MEFLLFIAVFVGFISCLRKRLGNGFSIFHPLDNRSIPSPPGHWLLGHLLLFKDCTKTMQSHRLIAKLAKDYGSIFLVRIFGVSRTFVSDAKALKHILNDIDTFARSPVAIEASSILGNPIITKSGSEWRHRRRIIQPMLSPEYLRRAEFVISNSADNMINRIKSMLETQDSVVIDIHQLMSRFALDVFCNMFLSMKQSQVNEFLDKINKKSDSDIDEIEHSIGVIAKGMVSRTAYPKFLWNSVLQDQQEMESSRKKLNAIIESLIEKRTAPLPEKDLLDLFLERDDMTREEILDEMVLLFIAGHETTANTITSAIYELSEPEIQTESKLKAHDSKAIDCIAKETLRMHPSAPFFFRSCTKDTRVLDHVCYKGDTLVVGIYTIHYDTRYWQEPYKFNPDRFMNDVVPGSFMPFGSGPQMCAGQKLAMSEIKTILEKFLSNFKWSKVDSADYTEIFSTTLGFKNGCLMKISL